VRGRIAGAVWLAVALLGCSALQPRSVRIDSAAGTYQGVTLTYRLDGGQLSEPLTVARIAGHQVTQESVPSSPYPDHSVARLSIRYPHPDGKAGYALAELVVATRTPPNAQAKKAAWQQWIDSFAATARDILPGVKLSDDVHEAWAMDISKGDLDRVIAGMVQSGYFANPSKASVGVELAARIDNFQANKQWSREPELDILMERIRQEGRLVSYEHPAESGGATIALAAANTRTPTRFVAQEEAGPALLPAGPQNNAYANPPESPAPVRRPQYTPPPTSYTPAPLPSPPAAPTTLPSYQRPATPDTRRPPATTPPATAPPAKPSNRWQYPPQFRRPATQSQAPAMPKQALPPTTPPGAARNATPQRQQRMSPWRRPGATDPSQQATAGPPAKAPPSQAAARSQLLRNSAAPPKQPPSAGRMPPRYRAPAKTAPVPADPYSGYPQTSTPSSDGYPAGLPQPPQLNPAPPQLGSRASSPY
jgi:hypothetical protein